ncbi:hypothetical protein FPV67DRAFT_1139693 [Lyophyllum atratum]|nr:hypothetical protein FPV67DRAFT_1139693 [Lyophyllum atratum]
MHPCLGLSLSEVVLSHQLATSVHGDCGSLFSCPRPASQYVVHRPSDILLFQYSFAAMIMIGLLQPSHLVFACGLIISYAPQLLRIINKGSSEGFSPWFLLLGSTWSAAGFLNMVTMQWRVVKCCLAFMSHAAF